MSRRLRTNDFAQGRDVARGVKVPVLGLRQVLREGTLQGASLRHPPVENSVSEFNGLIGSDEICHLGYYLSLATTVNEDHVTMPVRLTRAKG